MACFALLLVACSQQDSKQTVNKEELSGDQINIDVLKANLQSAHNDLDGHKGISTYKASQNGKERSFLYSFIFNGKDMPGYNFFLSDLDRHLYDPEDFNIDFNQIRHNYYYYCHASKENLTDLKCQSDASDMRATYIMQPLLDQLK